MAGLRWGQSAFFDNCPVLAKVLEAAPYSLLRGWISGSLRVVAAEVLVNERFRLWRRATAGTERSTDVARSFRTDPHSSTDIGQVTDEASCFFDSRVSLGQKTLQNG